MKRFKKFYIEITNVCNLKCNFCPQTQRKQEFMSMETFENILDQIKPYTDYIYFHVKGEPLLHPLIDRFLDLSYEKGFQVNITTNGTLIQKAKDKLIAKPALRQINFSLHSFDGNEGFNQKDEYINNILSFIKEAKDLEKSKGKEEAKGKEGAKGKEDPQNIKAAKEHANLLISLRLWNLTEDNNLNLEMKRNAELLNTIEKEFNLPYNIQEKIIPGRGTKIADEIYLNQDHEFKWPDLKEEEDDGIGFCYGLRNQIAMLVDGTVVPCCLDGEGVINLGNNNTTQFSDILESERVNNILEGFSRREAVEELCRKCGYRKRFGK